MRTVDFGVTYRKSVSDGNYGTEAAEVHMSGVLESEDDAADQIGQLLEAACECALEQLEKSVSPAVRRAVLPPPKREPVPSMHTEVEEEIPF